MTEHDDMMAADAVCSLGVTPKRMRAVVRTGRLVGSVVVGRVCVVPRSELDVYRAQAATQTGGRPKQRSHSSGSG